MQPSEERDPWLINIVPNPAASLRIFCFPFAGVGASVYFPWLKLAHPDMEVIAVQPPGREDRIRETPLGSIGDMVVGASQAISRYADQPYCLFGHSMGALIAFETARHLRAEGYASPKHLFVSARRAPHCLDPGPRVHHLPDGELVEELFRRWNGIPAAILREPELLKMLLPGLRADLGAIEKYTYEQGESLDCPMSVFGGENDKSVEHDGLLAWKRYTKGSFRLRMFRGDHFFIREHRQEVVQAVVEDLLPYLSGCQCQTC